MWLRCIKPLYDLMIQRVLQSRVIGTDDTVMPMLAPEKTRPAPWVYRWSGWSPASLFSLVAAWKTVGYSKPTVLLADAKAAGQGDEQAAACATLEA